MSLNRIEKNAEVQKAIEAAKKYCQIKESSGNTEDPDYKKLKTALDNSERYSLVTNNLISKIAKLANDDINKVCPRVNGLIDIFEQNFRNILVILLWHAGDQEGLAV